MNEETKRMNYAQKKLMDLVEQRALKKWCVERGLPHTTLYKLAVGISIPTFTQISSLLPYFAPAE
ncbi:hypothetical protein [Treponema sp.]|uniref:hypothetical protein n=1 Tax=Treponema sp. TaxID=166 RepID=UPI003F02C5C7